ncbi:MAG TPA: class I SAM-dependent methyltransferase, partial [Bryobacteraceae bacterium]|nr:class I SAM-dependent methyltransferase [Bryobacteraceae bacterium]
MPLPRVLEAEVMSSVEEAGAYDEMDFSTTDLLFAERAAQLVSGASGPVDLIADLGSGNAKIPLAMCPLLPGATRVCAVEMSPEMLAVAARNRARDGVLPGRLQLVTADVKHMPFADRSVGMITSNSLVHHIPDPRVVFLEIARIARPGAPIL